MADSKKASSVPTRTEFDDLFDRLQALEQWRAALVGAHPELAGPPRSGGAAGARATIHPHNQESNPFDHQTALDRVKR